MTNRKRNLKKENQAELNERKQQVLWAVVQDYAETAEPVGSRTIAPVSYTHLVRICLRSLNLH